MIINSIGSGGGGVKLPVMTTPASPDKVLAGYETIGQDGTIQTGTIETVGLPEPTVEFDESSGSIIASVIAGPGYLDVEATKTTTFDIPIVDIATPTVGINENGLITATQLQTKGYIKETGSASATMQLQVRTSDDLILDDDGTVTAPAGYYPQAAAVTAAVEPAIKVSTTGLITATAGSKEITHQITKTDIPTLLPGNIRKGVSICGVTGTVTGGVVTTVTVTTGVSGAVVTAKCGTTTQTGTCDSSGVVTINLTMAGTWTITAEHPSNGAYSTNAASVSVQNNFPISLTVGSSTTVSATGKYTATLNMAYRPGLTTKFQAGASYQDSFKWFACGISNDTSSEVPYFTYAGGISHRDGQPRRRSSSNNKDFNDSFNHLYVTKSYTQTGDYMPRNATDGVVLGRWGNTCATLKHNAGVAAVFAGGYTSFDTPNYCACVDAFISTRNSYYCMTGRYDGETSGNVLVPTGDYSKKINLSVGRAWLAGSGYVESNDGYALFAGGQTNSSGAVSAVVDYVRIYDVSAGTYVNDGKYAKGTCSNLSVARSHLAGCCHLNDYILFGGGKNSAGSPVANVDAYSPTRVKSTPTALSVARYGLSAAVGGGTFLLFAGGVGANGVSNVVDAYNLSRTRTTPVTLSVARHDMAGFSMGEYAVFACGRTSISSGASAAIDMIGPNMVRSTIQSRSARYGCCGCSANSVGSIYGHIFGGWSAANSYAHHYEQMILQLT